MILNTITINRLRFALLNHITANPTTPPNGMVAEHIFSSATGGMKMGTSHTIIDFLAPVGDAIYGCTLKTRASCLPRKRQTSPRPHQYQYGEFRLNKEEWIIERRVQVNLHPRSCPAEDIGAAIIENLIAFQQHSEDMISSSCPNYAGLRSVVMRYGSKPTETEVIHGFLVYEEPYTISKDVTWHRDRNENLIVGVSGGKPVYRWDAISTRLEKVYTIPYEHCFFELTTPPPAAIDPTYREILDFLANQPNPTTPL